MLIVVVSIHELSLMRKLTKLLQWAINFGGTKVFGEMEFWFCSIKVSKDLTARK